MRTRLTITLDNKLLKKVDEVVDGVKIRNRSHAIEYFLNQSFYSREMQAVILAGGEGTRMRPFTYEMPKSMLMLNKKPLLEHIIMRLKEAGVRDLIICINQKGHSIRQYFGDGSRFEVRIAYVEEKKNLGTGGALSHVRSEIQSGPFLVLHADVLTNIDLKELISFHRENHRLATMALKVVRDPARFGQIDLKGSLVTSFEKNKSEQTSNLVNAGIYMFETDIFSTFPQQKEFSLEEILSDLVKAKKISGYVFDGMWFDVGTPEDYEKALSAMK